MSLRVYVTLRSYGLQPTWLAHIGKTKRRSLLSAYVLRLHLEFLRDLPSALGSPGVTFVHAGLRRGIKLSEQNENDLLWMRPDPKDDVQTEGPIVIHGHTQAIEPVLTRNRICL